MKTIGITGQNGFLGTHLYNTIGLYENEFQLINFEKDYFNDDVSLDEFVKKCDIIVHLAAVNRHEREEYIYEANVELAIKLIAALERTKVKSHIIMSSSTQEERDNHYGRSKKEGRTRLEQWAQRNGAIFTGLIIPNIFGAFGKPFYNSFIATFCYQLNNNLLPEIAVDGLVKLIYVQELVETILEEFRSPSTKGTIYVQPTCEMKVSDVLTLLEEFKFKYLDKGEIPKLDSTFELNLFNTFRSYINYKDKFPVLLTQNIDTRGAFTEIIRLGIGGQVSFSTTFPEITRGNHFHTRKVERFTVIRGKALIQLRRIGTEEVLDFVLDGDNPSYVDMPIWYTHNITNIGDDILYTIFWINEPFDVENPDTYFVSV